MAELAGRLEVTGLRKSFGSQTVLDLDFTLEPGDFCLVLGENGVGKSTFFRCLLGLENYEGTIRVDGAPPSGAIIGVLDQPMLYPKWTTAQNVNYVLNDSRASTRSTVRQLIGDDLVRRRVGTLSTGQKKMVLLATALASDSRIVLLDEFANGLDHHARELFRTAVSDQLRLGRSFVATGHDLSAFDSLPTRVLAMHAGTVVDLTPDYQARNDIEEIYAQFLARTDS